MGRLVVDTTDEDEAVLTELTQSGRSRSEVTRTALRVFKVVQDAARDDALMVDVTRPGIFVRRGDVFDVVWP